MDFLGWYSTGDRPTLAEIAIHRQITDINESPLFLQLSPGESHHLPEALPSSKFNSLLIFGGKIYSRINYLGGVCYVHQSYVCIQLDSVTDPEQDPIRS